MSFNIKARWKTKEGFDAFVLLVNESHHCGYVGIGKDHPLYNVDYSAEVTCLKLLPKDEPVGLRGPMVVFSAATRSEDMVTERPNIIFDVHGGLTFSNFMTKLLPDIWFFGFDCAHYNDGTLRYPDQGTFRSVEYCIEQCNSLSEQLISRVLFPFEPTP